jgi:membrane-bound lytic murein transglycosylase B
MRLCFDSGRGAILLTCLPLFSLAAFAGDVSTPSRRVTSVVRSDLHSGKLVRSVIVTPRIVPEQRVAETVIAPRVISPDGEPAGEKLTPPGSIDEAVDRIAAQHSLSAPLIHSVIKVESNYNPYAVSSKGAQGLMQLIPSTARRFGVRDVFNPVDNIQGGAKYLKYLLDLYHNDSVLALAAYNAGEGAVAKYGTVPPYKETQNYLHLVADQLKKAKAKSAAGTGRNSAQTGAQAAETIPGEPNHIQKVVDRDGTVRYVTR